MLPRVSSPFRYTNPPAAETPVGFYHAVGLLGATVMGLFGLLQETPTLGGPAPTGPSVLIGGLFVAGLAAHYVSGRVLRGS